jgi:hypothetical protein
MELSKYAQAIKSELVFELQKIGYTISDFEHALQNLNTGQGVLKTAGITEDLMNQAKSLPETVFKTSIGAGALGGFTMDDMESSVDRMNKAISNEKAKLELIQRLTNNLKRDHGLT